MYASLATCCAQDRLRGNDVDLFDGPAFGLAKAVQLQSRLAIRMLVKKNPALLQYKEPSYGMTLLYWAIWNAKRRSSDELLKLGADPNVLENYSGESPLIEAARNEKTAFFVQLLLKHGANPNLVVLNPTPQTGSFSPLMAAASSSLENTRLLLEAGADINYRTASGYSAVNMALVLEQVDIAHYLLIEKKVDGTKPMKMTDNGHDIYPINLLRNWTFKLDSEEYRKKMMLVEYLATQGQNYWQAPIPKRFYEGFPKEYLEKY
jgi:hypothetical protein